MSIACDNQQTVDLLTKEGAITHTKLRHVDINRLWMKQEVNTGRIHVDWIPTSRDASRWPYKGAAEAEAAEIPRSAWDEKNPPSDYTP